MFNIAVLVSGGGTNLQAIIDAVGNGTITDTAIAAVISSSPKAYALERAAAAHIKTYVVVEKRSQHEVFEQTLHGILIELNPDLIVLAGYLKHIPLRVIQKFAGRIINIHPSLIPAFCGAGYYGLKVHEAVLARGVKVTGATVHFVDEIYDNGPIFLQKAVNVHVGDTPEILQQRVMVEAEWVILPEAINLLAHGSSDK